MHRNDELDRDLAWFRQELNRLDDPELPPSLSAEKLFSRLEELEQAEQESGGGWTPSLLCAFTGGSGAQPRWTHWKPMLTAAAVFCTITRPFRSSAFVRAKAPLGSPSKKSFLARMYSAKVLW